jgi:hypothetical protein
MKQPTIKVFDKSGKVLAEAPAKCAAMRISVKYAAWQRQLDTMYCRGASTAEIGNAKFKFDAHGVSQHTGFKP